MSDACLPCVRCENECGSIPTPQGAMCPACAHEQSVAGGGR